jgi:hypothetical protein
MKTFIMPDSIDLYQHKLALILGRGKRLRKVLRNFPTERKFKEASMEEIASVIGIKNSDSRILDKLNKLDITYDQMLTFLSDSRWSKAPEAHRLMGIDTEYLKSDLDCIQYVVLEDLDYLSSGFIFTNNNLATSVSVDEGINYLRRIIDKYKPELIVGHNFNSDLTVLENAYGQSLPELYFYDDTMDLMTYSNLSNIIGGSSLKRAIEKLFKTDVIGLFTAYNDINLLVEYGIKDALYPILLRYYIINGSLPTINTVLRIDSIIKEENRMLLKKDSFELSFSID